MPLTTFQRGVLQLLAEHRNPESFVAGGTVINRSSDSPRYSDDVDIFHDAEDSVAAAADADLEVLTQAGFEIERLINRPSFQRALISQDEQSLRLEWAQDSACRFFPVEADEEFGWRLHLADLATNKVLALAGRWEVRDFVDTLYLEDHFASLGLLAWAAVGKDPGWTPLLILEQANRFNRLRPEDFLAVLGTDQFDLVAMKARWRESVVAAQVLVSALPPAEVGALYLDAQNRPVNPLQVSGTRLHYPSLGGAWPQLVGAHATLPAAIQSAAEDQTQRRYHRSR